MSKVKLLILVNFLICKFSNKNKFMYNIIIFKLFCYIAGLAGLLFCY